MVVLYDKDKEVIGDVEYNNNLDYWDGHNYINSSKGRHKGFGQLETGEYYFIYGTQWQGENNYAQITTPEEIIKEAIRTDNIKNLDNYPELLELYETKFNKKTIDEKSKVFSLRISILESEEDVTKKITEFQQRINDYRNLK